MAKGHKTGGRKKGTPNKATAEVRSLAGKHMAAAIARLVELMRSTDPAVSLAACNAILDRGHGKPAQAVLASVSPRGGEGGFHAMWVALTTGKLDEAVA
jgi:hypothetical protein